jgi:hypothetical protein
MTGNTTTLLVGYLFTMAGAVACLILPNGLMMVAVSTTLMVTGAVLIVPRIGIGEYPPEDGKVVP